MKIFTRIVIWLGFMAAFTLLAMGIWYVCCGGSRTTESLKWLQFLQTIGTFLLPAIIGAWIWSEGHKPFTWLRLTRTAGWQEYLLAVAIMICALPAINMIAEWNSAIKLPENLDLIEQKLREMEDAAAALTERFLKTDSIGGLLINIGLMALLPAMSEEISFRGTLQQIITKSSSSTRQAQVHLAVWLTAVVFSVIHMQFYGFIPRMLMGAMFGYIFVWTGSLWVPIVMHFTNNGIAVIVYYLSDGIGGFDKNYADSIGAGTTWWLGVISLIITSLGLLIFYRRTHTR